MPLPFACSLWARRLFTSARSQGTFTKKRTYDWAERVVFRLNESERKLLLKELLKYKTPDDHKVPSEAGGKGSAIFNAAFLRVAFVANCLPFIGFGFLDNAIMITAGEYIDFTFSSAFGLSTMAAAGLGNWVSDLCGMGTVGYVERFCARLGFIVPPLNPSQLGSRYFRWITVLGRLTGITIGCLLGMLPLLWMPSKNETHKAEVD